LSIFTVELVLQFTYNGLYFFYDGWLIFDLIIVCVSWTLSTYQVIRAFRIFRALRLITRVKVLKNLVVALLSVLPRMAAIGCLMGLIFYIFAVMFTSLFKDIVFSDGESYFGRLDYTLFTLFQMMTLDWAGIARELMAEKGKGWAWIPIVTFILISSFIVYNLIVAVICDAIFVLHDSKDEGDDGCNSTSSHEDFDHMALKRINEIAVQVRMLQDNQTTIQKNLASLSVTLKDLDVYKNELTSLPPQDMSDANLE